MILNAHEAPKYTPYVKHQQDISPDAVQEWEKELMEDPKVRHMQAKCNLKLITLLESPRSCSSLIEPSRRGPWVSVGFYCRHPELQHQDSPRGLARHQPSFLRAMLAICIYQCISYRHYEEVQAV